jgi:hypothetical protein
VVDLARGRGVNEDRKDIQRQVLSEAFQAAMDGYRLRTAVFLTFSFAPAFFEQDILPVFFDISLSQVPQARVLHLADALRVTGPIAVYYDAGALEAGSGPPRTNFDRIGIHHRGGYFHPKNVLLLVERLEDHPKGIGKAGDLRLVVASLSANLTRAGWWENVEVAHLENFDEGAQCPFLGDLRDLLGTVRRLSPQGSDHAALDAIVAFLRRLHPLEQRVSEGLLLTRMYAGKSDLPTFLDELAGNRLRRRCLEVISPYFDETESLKPLQDLLDRFKPRETRLYLPRGMEGDALCSKQYWHAVSKLGAVWGTLPKGVIFWTKSRDRNVHAKVYRFFDPSDRRQTFFIGSVNLTNAGFSDGGNIESGFLIEVEGSSKSYWWLETDKKEPSEFRTREEAEGLEIGLGTKLTLRYNWTTGVAHGIWDDQKQSPVLTIAGSGVALGQLGPLTPRTAWPLGDADAERLKQHLVSSSFVAVQIAGEADATILVEEEGVLDKPSLLARLPPEEILRYWSLLTDDQKAEFFDEHAGDLNDEEIAKWTGQVKTQRSDHSFFAAFAHVYLSFGNLERAIRKALAAGRHKEAVDRLFGKRFDTLKRLVERLPEKEVPDPVADYVTLLCALQLLTVIKRDEPEFAAMARDRFTLIDEIETARDRLRPTIRLESSGLPHGDEQAFFTWLDRWFLRRAEPASRAAAEAR